MTTILSPEQLYLASREDNLPFDSSADLEGQNDFLGQERARRALQQALAMPHDGYNVFAVGAHGLGKRTMILRYLRALAQTMPAPADWCYVNNFDDPRRPLALQLPSGVAPAFKRDVDAFWRRLTRAMEAAFENDLYYERMEGLKGELSRTQQGQLSELAQAGEKKKLKLVLRTPGGYGFSPMNEAGEVMSVEEFAALTKKAQAAFKQVMDDMEGRLRKLAKSLNREEQINREKMRQLNEEVASSVLEPEMAPLLQAYTHLPACRRHLQRMQRDILENIDLVLNQGDQQDAVASVTADDQVPSRYQVNVLVSHAQDAGAPIVFEDLPTHYNLLGHVEQITYMGTVATDFTLIRGGALHRANGGFLMLEAEQVLEQPYAWQGLKRALRSKAVKFSSLEQMLTLTGTLSLEADAIPLQVKIILLGDRETFHLLQEFDPELADYFKIRADFEATMPRTPANELLYARFLTDFVRQESLRHLERAAVARVVEESARWAGDQRYIALHAASVADLLREADHLARSGRSRRIRARHIEAAIAGMEARHDRLRRDFLRDIEEGGQLFVCQGEVLAQVNALTVIDYAGFGFGQPSRVTATTHCGSGDVVDIERDVDLGGPLHSKGVLILSHYLRATLGHDQALRFSGSLAFEQSYGGVDGDSASVAELCALISSLSGYPVRQSLAITGSMNQRGDVQPIGGVNEKIEGFFAACQLQGLRRGQGVIIPVQNVRHLMLRADVVEAVRAGKFVIHAVAHVDQALSLLLGREVGVADAQGAYAQGTILAAVQEKLERWRQAERKDEDDEEEAPPPSRSGRQGARRFRG